MNRWMSVCVVGCVFALACGEEKKEEGPPPPLFTEVATRFERPLNAVWVQSETSAFAVGGGGLVVRFDGTRWAAMESGTTEDLHAIWGHGDQVRAVGSNGLVLTWDGSEWSAENVENTVFRAICGAGPDDVWALGDAGLAAHFDGSAWSDAEVPLPESIEGAWLAEDGTGFFVGFESGAGVVTGQYEGEDGWRRLDRVANGVGALTDLQGRMVPGELRPEIWATGADTPGNGALLRWDGSVWQLVVRNLSERPRALEPTAESIWLGGTSQLLRVDPAAPDDVESMTIAGPVNDLHAGGKLLVAVGGSSEGRIWTRLLE